MAESPSSIESIRKWIVEHKLRAVGCLWLSGIGSSIAYNWSRHNMKPSVKIIHARFVLADLFFSARTISCFYLIIRRKKKKILSCT
ncbi:Hypoxia induced protein conserved region [Musa troglodytarum]|uniref:Hypoxia induced protein conserved region n=1 Tax=Musa troglodytarum TaxID=320322 RepID=A0A9E7EGD3_9LILI|nr:Hypoxia induced protein conserved region [Musa troglodytarum]